MSNTLQTVGLEGVSCLAYHGLYPAEQKLGSTFITNIYISYKPTWNQDNDNIDNTINYELLQQIVIEEMKNTQKLIESVANNILQKTLLKIPKNSTRITIEIRKMSPPLEGRVNNSIIVLDHEVY